MNQIVSRAKEIEAYGIEIRRRIHKNPELGVELPKTVALL